jgi:putative membrane protein
MAIADHSRASRQGGTAMKTCIVKPAVATLAVIGSTWTMAEGAATTPARIETAGTIRSAAAAELDRDDRTFVERAAAGVIVEVEMSKLGQEKASSGQVTQFATRMAQVHGKANQELKQLAQAKDVAVPPAPDKWQQNDMDELGKLSGLQFDRQYMARMVLDQQKTVAEFRKASQSAKDSEVKAFAAKTLPKLQDHLTQAQSINETVKSASK